MASLSGLFWGGMVLAGAGVGVGSALLPSQILESLELTTSKTKSEASYSEDEEFSSEPSKAGQVQESTQSTNTSGSSEGKVETLKISEVAGERLVIKGSHAEGNPEDVPIALPQVAPKKTGCVIHQLVSSSSKPWKFKNVGSGESFLNGKRQTAAYKRIKAACDKAEGGSILIKNKKQSWLTWDWDYEDKDQKGSEFTSYLSKEESKR
ncbi:hypothetical protein HF1_06360 [Mycoplasma haemofelis str. Langford 1]|uniref:Uncharacterized protein n=2 Tax=Mycoplasma haemofelis TaxID=29501 RepID=F6FIB1_MYCHI|nr:hypothetical protein [Mycoplasma haemofelis]AEG72959.1 hypothetical protein MHF_0689 [Mycoplasma haemofelis Ohio2]CBY92644.1 hypothetical protein HF1_06360 [Mycoplasma haemofelis str. Langford 1]